MDNLYTLRAVGKTYRSGEVSVAALKKIDLMIATGKFVSFVGPSGSGKTTLLNLLGCLDKASEGEIVLNGTNLGTLNRRAAARFRGEHIGFIFQNFNLLPVLTVYENVEYPLVMVQNVPEADRKQQVMALLDKVGMLDQRDKYPNQLSGGQKQRVAVARALVTQPNVVLADEPTANLDHATAYKVLDIMHAMKEESGTTFIFATHDHKIVGEAEVVYTIEDGEIVQTQQQNGGHES
jgi:putative ABC transport system ATP-binding protein